MGDAPLPRYTPSSSSTPARRAPREQEQSEVGRAGAGGCSPLVPPRARIVAPSEMQLSSLEVGLPRGIPEEGEAGHLMDAEPCLYADDVVVSEVQTQLLGVLGPHLSLGSVFHALGECRPCAWMWKESGCSNGQSCRHCHLCPEGEARRRKKAKRVYQKVKAAEHRRLGGHQPLGFEGEEDEDDDEPAAAPLAISPETREIPQTALLAPMPTPERLLAHG
eukprot:TRINITY_DN8591_c0_g1_i1.p1 TRINITY_DN8591_c0_g1~~TRINITY_DN8591_c0_g1_i1.p1  ORF type:complete len:220 (-),score=26.49 TRINITY_DN8591_c0_g1_i1:383-1042(-)